MAMIEGRMSDIFLARHYRYMYFISSHFSPSKRYDNEDPQIAGCQLNLVMDQRLIGFSKRNLVL